jgi:hypothetical protein
MEMSRESLVDIATRQRVRTTEESSFDFRQKEEIPVFTALRPDLRSCVIDTRGKTAAV